MKNEGLVGKASNGIHRFLGKSLKIHTEGIYEGDWVVDIMQQNFYQCIKNKKGIFFKDEENFRKFPISDIASVDVVSTTKNVAGIAKASIGGALLAGPVGAIAAGAFIASKDNRFVEIVLSNDLKLYGYLDQEAYEQVEVAVRGTDSKEFSGIEEFSSGGELNLSSVVFMFFCFLMFIVILIQG